MRSCKVAALLGFTSIARGNIGVILLTILILTLVGLNLLFVPSLLGGLVSGANDKLVTTYSSDIVITSESEKAPLLVNASDLLAQITALKGVVAATARNSTVAQISFGGNRAGTTIYGIQPDLEQKVFKIDRAMVEGSYLSPNDRGQIVLGIQLAGADRPNLELYARSLQSVHAGDKVNVSFGNGVQKQYAVKGIFHTEFIQTDSQVFITQAEFESIMPNTKDNAAYVHVKTSDNTNLQAVIPQIKNLRGEIRILTWQDYAGIVRSMTDSFNVIRAILNIVNVLVAGITVFIVTYIEVTNRRRQIGIQRAIGITPGSITLAYLMRATFLAVVGIALAGVLFLKAVMPFEAEYPFHFPFGAVYLQVGFAELSSMALILLGVSVVAAFLPVLLAMRMKIMDAIWG